MALSITHPFVSTVADGPDATKVQKTNWNAAHTIAVSGPCIVAKPSAGSGNVVEAPLDAAGYGTTGRVLSPDGAGGFIGIALPPLRISIGNGSSAIVASAVPARFISMPVALTIGKWRIISQDNIAGSISIDVWKDTYANYPPTAADKISASAPISLSSAAKNEDSTLTGWTKTIAAGDVLGFYVSSASTVKRVEITIEWQ